MRGVGWREQTVELSYLSSVDVIFVRGNGRMVDRFETECFILEIQSTDIHCRTCPHIPDCL